MKMENKDKSKTIMDVDDMKEYYEDILEVKGMTKEELSFDEFLKEIYADNPHAVNIGVT